MKSERVYHQGHGTEDRYELDLQTAADQLGVHYQTAYRWVRNGRLDAELIGGRYLVNPDDIVELNRERQTPRLPQHREPPGSSMRPTACTRRS